MPHPFGYEPIGGYITIHGQCDTRPMVTFPGAGHIPAHLSSSHSQLGPLHHPGMTSMDSRSLQISRWEVVFRANLIQPLASWATRRTLPSAVGKSSKTDVDLAPKGLMCWGVVPKSGYIGIKLFADGLTNEGTETEKYISCMVEVITTLECLPVQCRPASRLHCWSAAESCPTHRHYRYRRTFPRQQR